MSPARMMVLLASIGLMVLLQRLPADAPEARGTLSFGFLLIAAYLTARLLARFRLPKITGYILAGILFGPSVTGLLTQQSVLELKFIDDLALNFIALAAGLELRLDMLRARQRSIGFIFFALLACVFVGVTAVLWALSSVFPFSAGQGWLHGLAVAAISGAMALTLSPASCIAIISETKAQGPFTETVLGVTVATDVVAILIFAVTLSLAETVLTPGQSLNLLFLLGVAGQITASLLLGLLLGKGIASYLKRVRAQLTVFTFAVVFLVAKLSYWLAHELETSFQLSFHLEPMLICLAAGFVVQNFSKSGEGFSKVMDRSSLPIYVLFFTISGAALQLSVLQATWHWALVLAGLRLTALVLGCWAGGALAGDPPLLRRYSGLSLLPQAGVSLGLVKMLVSRWGGGGSAYATLLVAAIAINQVFGPAALKLALSRVGETREARLGRRGLHTKMAVPAAPDKL